MKHLKLAMTILLLAVGSAAGLRLAWQEGLGDSLGKTSKRVREARQGRVEYEKWAKGRDSAELEREREWESAPMTPCDAFGRGSAPQVCIEHSGPATAPIGTPVAYRVRWRNLPRDAYIRIWSRNAAGAGGRWRYMGAQGAIAPEPLGGSAEGDVRLTWDGLGVYCAPTDLPMMCDAGEVGRYVLRAAIMTGTDPFWPSWPVRNPVPVVRHARSESRPFVLDGNPRPVTVAGRYRSQPAHKAIVDAIRAALPAGALGTDWYVERRIDRLGPWLAEGRHYCAGLDLDRPLAGRVKVCFPRSRRDGNGIALRPWDITAHGDASLAPGLIRAEEAKAKATTYAIGMTGGRATFPSYPSEEAMVRALFPDPKAYDGDYQGLRDSARDAGLTFVEVNQPHPSFRDDPGRSWWLVEMGLWIGTIDGPRVADWGRVALRVDHDGHVCRVDPTGEREGGPGNEREVFSACRPGSRRRV